MADEPSIAYAAVLDTNIMLEASSCVDLAKHYNKYGQQDVLSPESILRRQKARESLLLSIHLHKLKASTFSLHEAIRITTREVDPDAHGAFENHAMIIWLYYVKDKILPDWTQLCPSTGDGEPIGDKADALLVEKAKEFNVPLVSHEGVKIDGIDHNCGIRKKAKAAGVQILTPKEFYGDMNELLESAWFMQSYGQGADAHIREKSSKPEIMRESMLWLQGYYKHILYGITEGRSEPVPVSLRQLAEAHGGT